MELEGDARGPTPQESAQTGFVSSIFGLRAGLDRTSGVGRRGRAVRRRLVSADYSRRRPRRRRDLVSRRRGRDSNTKKNSSSLMAPVPSSSNISKASMGVNNELGAKPMGLPLFGSHANNATRNLRPGTASPSPRDTSRRARMEFAVRTPPVVRRRENHLQDAAPSLIERGVDAGTVRSRPPRTIHAAPIRRGLSPSTAGTDPAPRNGSARNGPDPRTPPELFDRMVRNARARI